LRFQIALSDDDTVSGPEEALSEAIPRHDQEQITLLRGTERYYNPVLEMVAGEMIPFATNSVLQLMPTDVISNADLVIFLIIGVLAGAHCLGMCGPLVGFYANRMTERQSSQRSTTLTLFEVRQHALFNSGRVIGYAVVGALFGVLGGTLFTTIDSFSTVGSGVRAVAGLLVGGLVMAGGLTYVFRGAEASLPGSIPLVATVFRRVSSLLTNRIDQLAGSSGIVALGTVHAVLPCPIIYPAYLYAFAIGDPVRGGLSLAVLGFGTFPSLFAYGTILGTLTATQRAGLHRVLGVAFFALGYILLSHGLTLLGVSVPHIELPYYQPLTEP
jgi:sulfite exporter TauE/SafE